MDQLSTAAIKAAKLSGLYSDGLAGALCGLSIFILKESAAAFEA
jgi:hypothetical protein